MRSRRSWAMPRTSCAPRWPPCASSSRTSSRPPPPTCQPALASALAETARLARISEGLLSLTRSAANAVALGRDRCRRRGPRPPAGLGARGRRGRRDAPARRSRPGAGDGEPRCARADPRQPGGQRPRGGPGRLHRADLDPAPVRRPARSRCTWWTQGPGLTAEQRARALDRFWRGPTAEPGGTGLGLAIVAQLAGRCGGRAELRAADTGGVDAVVTLPVADRPTTTPEPLPRANRTPSGPWPDPPYRAPRPTAPEDLRWNARRL